MKSNESISPHGNTLINCFSENPSELLKEAKEFISITVTKSFFEEILTTGKVVG